MDTRLQNQAKTPSPSPVSPVQTGRFQPRPFSEPVEEATESLHSSHQPLDLETQLDRATRFGHNFSRVQVHTNTPAVIQRQVTTGQPQEQQYEQEGEWIAEPVKLTAPHLGKPIQRQVEEDEPIQMMPQLGFLTPAIQRQVEEDEPIQMMPQWGRLQRQEQEEDQEAVQMRPQLGFIQCQEQEAGEKPIQTKLVVGAPGDKYEQEADTVAAQVMSMPERSHHQPIQRLEMPEEEQEPVQTKPLASSITPLVQRETAPEEVDEDQEQVQTKPLQRVAEDGSSQTSSDIETQLNSSKGGGSPLPDEVRSFMEPRFGADFSSVQVHTDGEAVQMSQELGAQAFTHGSDIFFGAGRYNPSSSDGKQLLAHELTHVVQQTGAVQRKQEQEKNDDKKSLKVDQGQLTFDSEGTEGGYYHSRKAHWPGGNSGVTIGRGYDLGQHKNEKIFKDLTDAGISEEDARQFSAAAKLRGKDAEKFWKIHRNELPEITLDQQKNLFKIALGSLHVDVQRISSNAASKYGEVDWETLSPAIRDIVVDLRYRGDYLPETRQKVQPYVVKNDPKGLLTVMSDREFWIKHRGVPLDRFNRRVQYLEAALNVQSNPKKPNIEGKAKAGKQKEKPNQSQLPTIKPPLYEAKPDNTRVARPPLMSVKTGAATVTSARLYVTGLPKTSSELETLMAKARLTPEEIKHARQLIAKEPDEKHRGDLYEALQTKAEYHSQRDNEAKNKEGKNIGDVMCNLTSLAMCLSYLGVSNPHPELQFEDALETIRVDKKLPARTTADGWGGVAKELGVKVGFISSGEVTQGKDWYVKNVHSHLRQGHAVMMSISGHIVRVQAVTEKGLVADDPYGKAKLLKGTGRKWEAYNTSQNKWSKEKENAGEDTVWPWAEVAQHTMRWIAWFGL